MSCERHNDCEAAQLRADLAAATELLKRWYREYAKNSNISRETRAFLANQPAPAKEEP